MATEPFPLEMACKKTSAERMMSKLFTWCIYAIPGARESRPGTKLVGCAHRCPQLWHTRVPAHDKRQMRLRRRGTDGLPTHRWRNADSTHGPI